MSNSTQDTALIKLAEHWEKHCNRYENGYCQSRRCLVRGGYSGTGQVDYSIATCEEHETALALAKLRSIYGSPPPPGAVGVMPYRNPDGPPAADLIETLLADRQSLSDRIDVLSDVANKIVNFDATGDEDWLQDAINAARAALHQEATAP